MPVHMHTMSRHLWEVSGTISDGKLHAWNRVASSFLLQLQCCSLPLLAFTLPASSMNSLHKHMALCLCRISCLERFKKKMCTRGCQSFHDFTTKRSRIHGQICYFKLTFKVFLCRSMASESLVYNLRCTSIFTKPWPTFPEDNFHTFTEWRWWSIWYSTTNTIWFSQLTYMC